MNGWTWMNVVHIYRGWLTENIILGTSENNFNSEQEQNMNSKISNTKRNRTAIENTSEFF